MFREYKESFVRSDRPLYDVRSYGVRYIERRIPFWTRVRDLPEVFGNHWRNWADCPLHWRIELAYRYTKQWWQEETEILQETYGE